MKSKSLCRTTAFRSVLPLALGVLGPLFALAQVPQYSVQDLGRVIGTSINVRGQVAGYRSTATGYEAFVTGENGVGLSIVPIGASNVYAWGINDRGQIAGSDQIFTNGGCCVTEAFSTPIPGDLSTITFHGFLGASQFRSIAYGITNAGHVYGESNSRPFRTGEGGVGLYDMGSFGGGTGYALGANGVGSIVGASADSNGRFHAFLSEDYGALFDLGIPEGATGSSANDINDDGVIVGSVTFSDGTSVATVFTRTNGTVSYQYLLNYQSDAFDVNNFGVIVGTSFSSNGSRAFVSIGQTGPLDINDLVSIPGAVIHTARAVNDSGQILVNATNGRSYVLSPVPEISSTVAWLLGLSFLGILHHRRRCGLTPRSS